MANCDGRWLDVIRKWAGHSQTWLSKWWSADLFEVSCWTEWKQPVIIVFILLTSSLMYFPTLQPDKTSDISIVTVAPQYTCCSSSLLLFSLSFHPWMRTHWHNVPTDFGEITLALLQRKKHSSLFSFLQQLLRLHLGIFVIFWTFNSNSIAQWALTGVRWLSG